MDIWLQLRLEDIRAHRSLLAILRDRNDEWAKMTENTEIAILHKEMADLYVQAMAKYNCLLEKYASDPDIGTAT